MTSSEFAPYARIVKQMLPRALRDDFHIRWVEHRISRDAYVCGVEAASGLVMKFEVMDPRDGLWFPMDANLCRAIPEVFRRRSGFKPKCDAWTLLALWSLAAKLTVTSREAVGARPKGVMGLRIEFPMSALLRELRYQRRRRRPGRANDFTSGDWRSVRESLTRLAEVPAAFQYSPKRDAKRLRTYKATLISVDASGDVHGRGAGGRNQVIATLNFYTGVSDRFFVKLSRSLFAYRGALDEVDTRVVLWLARKHRGSTKRGGGMQRRWDFWVDLDQLAAALRLRPQHPSEARRRLVRAFGHLDDLWLVEQFRHDAGEPARLWVELSPMFFHDPDAER